MHRSIPQPQPRNSKTFIACLLSFMMLMAPIASVAAASPSYRSASTKGVTSKAATEGVSAKLEGLAEPAAPEAVLAPAPLAPPVVGSVTASLAATLAAGSGGIDADADGKADPGDTIAYTLSLANTSGAGATGLAIANPLDSHTTLSGSVNSTPVAFDQSVSLNEDATLPITLMGQDPDGSNLIFRKSDGTAFPSNPTTIATAHGTIDNFGSVSCDANGVCSQQVTYTPAANYFGPDSFSFRANDSTANSNENGVVTITVIAVNDAPTFGLPVNSPPAVNEDVGLTTVTDFISEVRPAQGLPTPNTTEDTQTVSFVITNITHSALFTAGGQPVLTVQGSGVAPFPRKANLTYTPAPNANGTSVVTYHLHDNGGTSPGVDNSADQTFTITVNAVNDKPVVDPVAKAFTVQANMRSVGFTGLLANATDPDATNANADALSADAAAGYTSPTFTLASLTGACTSIVANPGTGAGPCTITITSTSTGTFTFDPPPGVTGAVTLNYTISDNGNPGSATSLAGTINITVNGPVIWFVDPTRTNNGNGTLSGAADAAGNPGPFKSLASASNAINLKTGQRVFVYTGTTPAGEALDLSGNNNWLVGQGTVAANFDTFFGLTGGNTPPAATVARPTLNSNTTNAFTARPQISGTVTMRNNTQVTGVKIITTAATAGLRSVGFSAGTSLVKDVSVTTATGNAVDFSGTQTITYETSDNTNSPNLLKAVGGIALTVTGTVTIGANGFTFQKIEATGGTNGIVLNNTGATAGLTVTGTGSAGTGGTITGCTQKGADFRTAKNISLNYMNFTSNATVNLGASGTCGDALNGTNGPTTCNANIAMSSVTTATLTNVTATGSKQIGIDVKGGSDLTLTNVTATGNGDETKEDGVQITDLTGTLTVAGGLFRDNASNQFEVQNGVAGPLSVIVGTSTFSNTAFPTGLTTPANTTSNSGLFLATHSSAVMNPTITNCTVDRIYAQGIRLDMAGASSMTANIGPASGAGNGNTITNSNQAISLTGSNTGGFTYKIRNNTANITPANVAGGATNQIGVARSTASGTWNGLIESNFVGTVGTANSGCQVAGCDGIDVVNNSAGTHKLSILSNQIRQTEGSGMVIIAGGAPDNSNVSWIVKSNTISNPDQNAGQANPAILIQSGTSVGTDTSKTCLEISGNTISGTWSLGTGHLSSIRVRSLTTAAGSFAIVGFNPATEYPNDATGVSGSTTGAVGNVGNVADYIRQQNPGVTNASPGQNAASATQGAATFSNSGGCPLLLAEGGVMAALNAPSLISTVFFSSIDLAPAGPTAASPITTANAISASLTQPQLDTLVDASVQRWTATGLSAEQIASLREIKFEVTELTNAYLAESSGNRILVDRSAEGKGWFLDATPQDDSEFGEALAATRRYTDPQGAPAGHIDLLTAIGHEMGHKLGLGDSYLERDRNDLMYGYLTVGERRLPEKGQAARPTAGGSATSHYLRLEPSRMAIVLGEVLAGAVGAGTEVFDKAEAEISGQWSVVSALTGNRSPELGVSNQRSEVRGQRSDVRLNHPRANSKLKTENSSLAGTAAAPFTPIGQFPINGTGLGAGFQLPDGKTITITFKATLNSPPNFASYSATQKVSAQATLTGSFVGNPLLSDDPSVVGAADATSTNVDLYDSTVALISSSNPALVSQAVTFTATIGTAGTPNGSATTRTGTVIFKDGVNPITCQNPGGQNVNGSNVATCQISTLSNGNHTISADYSGDGNFDPSTGSLNTNPQVVNKSGTNAVLTSSLNPSTVTQNVTFTAAIMSATSIPNPTGTVTFKDGINPISCSNAGGQTLNGSGVATCQISTLGSGNHPITADYSGDTKFNANNGIVLSGGSPAGNQTVNKATPTVTLVSSTNPSFVSQNVTFTATVSAPAGIGATPSGTLTFKDGGAAMTCTGGTQSLSGGVATCQKNNLTAGSHTITVDYPTDSNFNAVSGTQMTASGGQNGNPQVVNQSNTTMTVTNNSGNNPSKVTESVTFKLNIKSSSAVPGPPAGTLNVKFWDGPANTGTQIGATKTLGNSGCADAQSACVLSDPITTLTAGTHTITVQYLGDTNFSANAQTLPGGQVVNKSDTTTTITSDAPDMSNVGQTVNIVGHVVSTGVTFTNTGTVLFKEGSNTISGCNLVPIIAGDATCSTNALPAGTLSLTAVYSGDATFNTSTSAAEPHQVGPTCLNLVTVSSNADDGSAGTLRSAISSVCDGGTITFDTAGLFASAQTIELTDANGELQVGKSMTITGPGASSLTVKRATAAATNFRVFEIAATKTVTISGITISNGNVVGTVGAAGDPGQSVTGGGILNAGTLTLTNVIVSGNHATGGDGGPHASGAGAGGNAMGGGIYSSSTLALINSTVNANNSATGGKGGDSAGANGNGGSGLGGGVYSFGSLTLTNSTIDGNAAAGGAAGTGGSGGSAGSGSGGGIYNDGASGSATATITGSTINSNTASLNGGGIFNISTGDNAVLTLTNSTISGNEANNSGGGLYNDSGTGTTTLTSVTVTLNRADKDDDTVGAGGGINRTTGSVVLQNTIVAGNLKGTALPVADDITGTMDATSSYNLIGTGGSGGLIDVSTDSIHKNQVGVVDAKLGSLTNNGGPTQTHALLNLSPALDTGNKFALTTDQRGFPRPVDFDAAVPLPPYDDADIGAFERQTPPAQPTITLTSANTAGTTRDSTPDFSISNLTVGATVELLRDGNPTSPPTTVVASAVTMALTDNTLTTDGVYSYSARQTIGGDTATSTATVVTVDTRPTVTALLAADDTGASSSDKITKNTTPRFTGTADNNTSILLFANAVQVGTGTSDGSGNWTITSSILVDGTYSITAKEVIGGFTGAASTALTGVVIDTSVAPPSTPVLLPADDSGTTGDNATNKTMPTFTGTAEPDSAIQLFANGNPVGAGAANGSGNWSVASSALSDGTYLITAVATDVAGNVSVPSGGSSVTIDTQVPAPSMPDLINADDSGAFNNDNYTNKTTPTFTGTAEAGSDVKLFAGAVLVGSGTATGGNWSIASSALTDGTYQITATATDPAGNISSASTALSVTIDTQVPPKPSTPDLVAGDDTGILNTDNITKTTTPAFSGTAEISARIDLFKDSGGGPTLAGTGNADGSGNWGVVSGSLADGVYQMTVMATDLAGNQSVSSDPLSVTIDTTPPPAPLALALLPADDTGTSNSDGITKKNTPTFTGTAEANSIVQLFAGATPVGSGTAAGGSFSITSGVLPDNSYNMTAQATDLAGNTGVASAPPVAITIDTVKPTVTMSSVVGNPTATTPIPVTVLFSENVAGFIASDVAVSNATSPVTNFAGSNANYSFDLTPTAAGGVSADIAADAATDAAGNGNTAAVQFNRTYDPSALNATITAISPNPRNTAVSSIQIVFNKPVTGFDLSDLTLTRNGGGNLLTGAQTLNSADNATWTLGNLAGITAAQGTYDLKLTAAGSNILDATSTALASDATASWVTDTTAPTVTVEQAVGQADPFTGPTGTTIINFTATFSESVTGLTPSGVTIFGTANPTIVNVTGSGTTYNLAVQGMSQSGTVRASVNASAATDSAGNGNGSSTSADNTVQFNADNFTTIEVNTTADPGDGVCDPIGTGDGCTLREAINRANADFGAETISFNIATADPGYNVGTGVYTINLGGVLPDLSTSMTISGLGANVLTVRRNTAGNYRIFSITPGNQDVTIDGLTISNGNADGSGLTGSGGGILTESMGTLNVTNSTISGNVSLNSGGGIHIANGTLNLTNSTISGNSGFQGGGLQLSGGGPANITNSTISGNSAKNNGGGISASGLSAPITITSSTITNNRADNDNDTIGTGGGINRVSGTATVTLRNTIVASNYNDASPSTTPDDIFGPMEISSSFNLIGTGGSGGLIDLSVDAAHQNQVGVADAGLLPLGDNGGSTFTHALTCLSPAIDKGFNFTFTTDQRAGTRPFDLADAVYPNAASPGNGTDIGAYEVQSGGGCVPLAVPPAVDPTVTNEDNPVVITLTGTYSQNTPLTFAITQQPSHSPALVPGPVTCNFTTFQTCTATVTYSPASNYFGPDTFKFTTSAGSGPGALTSDPADVNITVNPINDPPLAVSDPSQITAEDTPLPITLNGSDIDGGPLTFSIVNGPAHGSLTPVSGTDVTYTPNPDYNGPDSFTFKINDTFVDSNTATVSIMVTEVNDAPTAVNDALSSVSEDSGQRTITIASLLGNDLKGPANESGQTLTLSLVPGSEAGGTISSDATNVYFTPPANYNGPASFQYTVTDNGTTNGAANPLGGGPATVSFTVTGVNDAPTAVGETLSDVTEDSGSRSIPFATLTVNDSTGPADESGQTLIVKTVGNPVGGTVSILAGNVVFTPTANYTGPGSFDYTVEDNGTTNGVADPRTSGVATASFTITSVNDAPVAVNDTLTSMAEDAAPRAIPFADLTANDSKGGPDESGQTLTVISVGNAVGGAVLLVPGFVVFTPNGDYNGPASFTYTVQDNGTTNGAPDPKTSGSALVQFTITEVNDAPAAFNDTLPDVAQNSGERTIAFADLLANDVKGPADESGQTLTILTVGNPVGVTVSIVAGTVRVTPLPDFAGPAGFQYTVRDNGTTSGFGDEKTSVATVSFNVIGQGGGGGVLRFSAANYSVAEGAGFRTITVERTGDSSQAVTVDYASSDHSNPADFIPCSSPGVGFASSRCDFTTAIGTLRFAAGETSKTFNVLISNDNYVEGPETLELTLSNPTGGAVFGVPQTAILTINDDLSEPGTNPIDTSSEFVRSQYHDFLNREPDAPGLAFWTDNIELCNDASRRPVGQTVAQCIDKQRESTAVAFFAAPEFQITGGFVYNLYKGSLTGAPNYDGGSPGASPGRFPTSLEFMRDVGQVSEGIVVNNAISGAVVEANRNRLAAEFVQRPEFIIKYGGLNNTLYVDELFNTTGIAATPAQKQALVDGLTGGTETRASVLRKVVDGTVVISEGNVQFTTSYGQAFINQENRRKFVFMEYIAYLRRNPDTPGFVFWLGKLNFYNGDPFQAEMVRSFILSPEYRNRFGQP